VKTTFCHGAGQPDGGVYWYVGMMKLTNCNPTNSDTMQGFHVGRDTGGSAVTVFEDPI
jgi:hypothetical protein